MVLDDIPVLLTDRTTRHGIIWATDSYERHGEGFRRTDEMTEDRCLSLIEAGEMLPRYQKSRVAQQARAKAKAEVFTPSWVCNMMVNSIDEDWFGRKDVFNKENGDHAWTATEGPISFDGTDGWQAYVESTRLEITCGEAPYLVSRYDTVTGREIPITERIGMLDRKLRVIGENTETQEDWLRWARKAYESTYGYEYQGDNLLFARINLLQTFVDYYEARFGEDPSVEELRVIAEIITWNIWQMDGLKGTIPYSDTYAVIMDWQTGEQVRFSDIGKEDTR